MKKLIISLLILIIIVFSIVFCFNNREIKITKKNDKITIITTVYPLYDFAKQIAGDKANVYMLLTPGVEIHDYEPTPQDLIDIQNADLFLYLGDELEPWAKTTVAGLENKDNIIDVTYNVEKMKIQDMHDDESHEEYDTHIWLNPLKSVEIIRNITNELCEKDSINEGYYKECEENYTNSLIKLDNDFQNVVSNAKKDIIAFGGPFSYSYLVDRYKINYISVYDSCGEETEPSLDKILDIINQMKKNHIGVIFKKELSSGNIAKTISD